MQLMLLKRYMIPVKCRKLATTEQRIAIVDMSKKKQFCFFGGFYDPKTFSSEWGVSSSGLFSTGSIVAKV